MPKQYPKQQRDRAVRMVLDHLAEYESTYLACKAIRPKVGVGVGVESLRRWVVEAQAAGPRENKSLEFGLDRPRRYGVTHDSGE